MLVSDAVRALLILSLLFAPRAWLVPCLYAVSFLVACATAFFSPARSVTLRLILAPDEIARGQALARATESTALLIGPVLGASTLLRFGPTVGLLFDALSFGVGALTVLPLRLPPRAAARTRRVRAPLRGLLADLRVGLVLTARHHGLITLLLVTAVVHLVGNLWFAVDVFFVERSLGMPKESVGPLWTASGAGGLLGSAFVAAWSRRVRQRWILVAGLGMKAAAVIWYASSASYAWAMPAAFTSGLGGALVAVALGSLALAWTPPPALGRITALFDAVGQFMAVAAIAAVTLLNTLLTPAQLLLICGVMICGVCVGSALRLNDAADT